MDAGADTTRIGGFLVAIGAMRAWQVEDVLLAQQAGDNRMFGEIAIGLGYIDDAALQLYVESRIVESVRFSARSASGSESCS